MAVLVTRPAPDNERTAAALRARGFDVLLAPMLRFEPVALSEDAGRDAAAVIVTSSNALRAIAPQLEGSALLGLPLFAVGDQTAAAAHAAGFGQVMSASGDATALRELIATSGVIGAGGTLLYLAGADISRDLAGELAERGFDVVTQTVYRMVPVAALPRAVCEAFAANRIEAVLHYSRRSAAAFVAAIGAEGVEISALAVPHGCLSANVAEVLREAGATQVTIPAHPDENQMLEGLARALRS
ncbi:putative UROPORPHYRINOGEN-III synthase [Bradyrhizobium sp. ORS 285]|uniref:uroporphyrinogen-III synthase n=1 Tax=Bradyrhizobium sp. ORS 285 TaxID=115808 RepID=UPI0002406D94|nr:uroporphyrinogen-III synthase [Bradyrhizobium sp. ORS 285]CCD87861.1 putative UROPORPHYRINOGEN-III synthase [Bradyrhizobium sp. ORS 285]SMX62164.1 putative UROPORPHYRINOGEN-III synthase [Bradyrhizobium sp. ORS 285]